MQIFSCRLNDLPVLCLPFFLVVFSNELQAVLSCTVNTAAPDLHTVCSPQVLPSFRVTSSQYPQRLGPLTYSIPMSSTPPSSSPFFHPWLLPECVISQSPSNSDISCENIPVLDSSIPTPALYLFKTSGPVRISFPFIHHLLASFLSGST